MSMDLTSNLSILALLFGYLIGSTPFGLLLTKAAGLGDIRKQGSGNIGATNVLRTGRKGLAAATLVADMLKGAIPAYIGSTYGQEVGILAGLGAFLGHLFPIWLGFKGGKGIATYIGVLAGIYWPFALLFCVIWLATAFLFKMSSLSALVAAAIIPLAIATTGNKALVFVILIITILIFVKHHSNIKRLIDGTEDRIGNKDGG